MTDQTPQMPDVDTIGQELLKNYLYTPTVMYVALVDCVNYIRAVPALLVAEYERGVEAVATQLDATATEYQGYGLTKESRSLRHYAAEARALIPGQEAQS